MSIRQELENVRAFFESKDTEFLKTMLEDMGVDSNGMDRAEVLDKLMALEEHAAFH